MEPVLSSHSDDEAPTVLESAPVQFQVDAELPLEEQQIMIPTSSSGDEQENTLEIKDQVV